MPRLPCILLLVTFSLLPPLTTNAQDVPWLAEVTSSPANPVLPAPGRLDPILATPAATLDDWKRQREPLRARWLEFLGPMPQPGPLNLQVLKTEQVRTVDRSLVEYDGEPGLRVQGWLLEPRGRTGRLPALVGLHQTTNASIDEIAGVSGPDAMQIGLKLARRGFVVFCPRCFLWQDAANLNAAVEQHRQRHPKTTGMAKMLFDARRAVDVLESLASVDSSRIGAVGHSLGAKETLYLAAFDERIRASVACEGGLGFRSTNWDAPWYLGPAIRGEDFPLNHHQLLGLIAPRPFLVIGGESGPGAADGDRSWVLLNAALPVWKLYSPTSRLALLNHHQGHSIPDSTFERMAEWLQVYTANSGN
ncbi:MAG: dienelactone hydrolase family protein [Planctomycetota bacterium]